MMTFATAENLMPHQESAASKLLPPRVGALFMDMGTGKSRTLLELAKLRQQKYDRLFWLTPVSLRQNVRQQILEHTDLTDRDIYLFDDRTTQRGVPVDRRIYVVGIESLSASNRVTLAFNSLVTPQSYVAVDESSYIKGHKAIRTRRITAISERARYRAIMTGTPFTQGVVDLFSQMSFLSPKILGYRSFWSFANNHLEYEKRVDAFGIKRRTGRIIRSHNEDYLAAKIAPYTYQVRKDECLTLPDKLYETRYCDMTAEQRDRYEQAKQEILLDVSYDDWSPIQIFHLFTTLQTIVCGFWNRTDPATGQQQLIEVDHHRLDLLERTIEELPQGEPVVIWAKFRHSLHQFTERLRNQYGHDSVAELHGGISKARREANIQRWRDGAARFLTATEGVGGHGFTLNEAAYMIFYADGFKYSQRIQAEDRNHRIGQQRRPVYITLRCCRSIDDRIAGALASKGSALQAFQDSMNEYRLNGMKKKVIDMVRAL